MDICVRGSRSCTCQDRHAEGMLALTCWRAKYGEIVGTIFTSWSGTYCIYVCCIVLSGCSVSSGKYCKHSAFMIIFRYIEIKYSWKLIISLLKYCTLHKTLLARQYWQPYFCCGCSYQEYWFIFKIFWQWKMLWLKAHIAFNGLHILILSVM